MASDDRISKLPDELLLLIAEMTDDKKDHRALSLVSKKICDAAQPLLFREIRIGYNYIVPITRILVFKPNLAKSVQYLGVFFIESGLPARSFEKHRSEFDVTKEEKRFVIRHAEGSFMRDAFNFLSNKVDDAFKWFWLSLLAQNHPDVYLAFLFAFLPAVKDLAITLEDHRVESMSFLNQALATIVRSSAAQPRDPFAAGPHCLMGNLQRLYINHSAVLNTCSSLGALFTAPCLEDVVVDSWNSPKMPLDIVPATLKMRNIYIEAASIKAAFVSALIQVSPHLTNLVIGCGTSERANNWFKPVCDAISKRGDTLETLYLVTSTTKPLQTMPILFKSMADFRKLKNIDIPEPLLLGSPPQIERRSLFARTLPSCLETLRLSSCTAKDLEPLASIAAAGRDSFPALKLIFLDFGKVSDNRDVAMNNLIQGLSEIAEALKQGKMAHMYWEMRTLYTPAADNELEQFFQDNL